MTLEYLRLYREHTAGALNIMTNLGMMYRDHGPTTKATELQERALKQHDCW
jgi:hypothetical protein